MTVKITPVERKGKVERKNCADCKLLVRCIPPTGFKCPHGKKRIDARMVKP